MNDIIFKAKTEEGNWVYGYFVKYPDKSTVIFSKDKWVSYPIDERTLCRCLNEVDKNGDFIYLGDMVNDFGGGTWVDNEEERIEGQSYDSMVCVGDKTRICIVVEEDGSVRIRNNVTSYSFNISEGYKLSDMEIVGNIYD